MDKEKEIKIEELKVMCEERFKTIFSNIEKIENTIKNINNITISVEKIALSVNNICDVLKTHDNRLKVLESEKGKVFDTFVKALISNVVGIAIGYFMAKYFVK